MEEDQDLFHCHHSSMAKTLYNQLLEENLKTHLNDYIIMLEKIIKILLSFFQLVVMESLDSDLCRDDPFEVNFR